MFAGPKAVGQAIAALIAHSKAAARPENDIARINHAHYAGAPALFVPFVVGRRCLQQFGAAVRYGRAECVDRIGWLSRCRRGKHCGVPPAREGSARGEVREHDSRGITLALFALRTILNKVGIQRPALILLHFFFPLAPLRPSNRDANRRPRVALPPIIFVVRQLDLAAEYLVVRILWSARLGREMRVRDRDAAAEAWCLLQRGSEGRRVARDVSAGSGPRCAPPDSP
jgi:hypothetical protein